MKKSKKLLSLMMLLGLLSSCGNNSSRASDPVNPSVDASSEVASEKASEAESEVVSSEEIILITPTFTAEEGITQTGIELDKEYKVGDVITFTITLAAKFNAESLVVSVNGNRLTATDGSYSYTVLGSDSELAFTATADVRIIVPTFVADEDITQTGLKEEGYQIGETLSFEVAVHAMYKEETLEVKLNGELLTADAGVYSYTVLESDEAIEITATADLIDIAPTVTKSEEISIVGLPEVVHPNTEYSITLDVPAKLTVTSVKVNDEAVEATEGEYKFKLGKDATALAIVIESVDTKVTATGTITYKGGAFSRNQYDFMRVAVFDAEENEIDAEVNVVEGKINYSAQLPKFGDYSIKVFMTDDTEAEIEVYTSSSTFDAKEITKDIDIEDDIAERTTWKLKDYASTDFASGTTYLSWGKGQVNEGEEFVETFNMKLDNVQHNIVNENGKLTYGVYDSTNHTVSFSVDSGKVGEGTGNRVFRWEFIDWNFWRFKSYAPGSTDKDRKIHTSILEKVCSPEGLDMIVSREKVDDSNWILSYYYMMNGIKTLALRIATTSAGAMDAINVLYNKTGTDNVLYFRNAKVTRNTSKVFEEGESKAIYGFDLEKGSFTAANQTKAAQWTWGSQHWGNYFENNDGDPKKLAEFPRSNVLQWHATVLHEGADEETNTWANYSYRFWDWDADGNTSKNKIYVQFLRNGSAQWGIKIDKVGDISANKYVLFNEAETTAFKTTGLHIAIQFANKKLSTFAYTDGTPRLIAEFTATDEQYATFTLPTVWRYVDFVSSAEATAFAKISTRDGYMVLNPTLIS